MLGHDEIEEKKGKTKLSRLLETVRDALIHDLSRKMFMSSRYKSLLLVRDPFEKILRHQMLDSDWFYRRSPY